MTPRCPVSRTPRSAQTLKLAAMSSCCTMSLVSQLRALHRRVAPIVVVPLLLTVTTGVGYRLARDWFGMDREAVHWLMSLHEGEWLGETLEPVLVLLNALGLLWMLITGTTLLIERWRRQVQ